MQRGRAKLAAMEGAPSQCCSTSSVDSGGSKVWFCLCGVPTMMRTAWTSKNFGRQYCKCASNGCKYWDWVDPPVVSLSEVNPVDRSDKNEGLGAMHLSKNAEIESEPRDKESHMEKNEKGKKVEVEQEKTNMMANMEELLKESHKREEKYFKLLVRTWAVIGCMLIIMLKMS